MPSPFMLPPTGFGPGSQPAPEEGELDYMALPSGMRTYSAHVPEVADAAAVAPALALLAALADACDRVAAGGPAESHDVAALPPAARALIADTLGQGEVSVKLLGKPALAMQESVFAGVWAIRGAGVDRVEVAPVPLAARARAFAPSRAGTGRATKAGPGVVNAPALLAELLDATARPGLHVVNLTLLPHTPEDLAFLDTALGDGAATLLSRGYGNCRVAATATPRVWRVQFFNSMDTPILDTFEVTDVPEVALAAPEDLADSARRLRDVLEAIR